MRSRKLLEIATRYRLALFTLLYVSIFLCVTAMLAAKASMVADDFRFLQPDFPILSFIYNDDSGRVAHGIVLTINQALFGEGAVNVFPVAVVILFMTSLALLAFAIFRSIRAVLGSLVFAVLLMTTFHSFFDFSLFFSAATTHTLTLVYLITLASLLVRAARAGFTPRPYHYAFILLFCLFGSLLSELAAVLGGFAVLFFIAIAMLSDTNKVMPARLVKNIKPLHIGIILTSIAGFLIIYFSPGSTTRRFNNVSDAGISSSLQGALADYASLIMHFFTSLPAVLALISGSIILFLLIADKPSYRQYVMPTALFFLFLPVFVFLTTNYSLGYTAMRMYNMTDFFFFTALSLLLVKLALWLNDRHRSLNQKILIATCALLAVVCLGIFIARDARDIYLAESMRKVQLEYRQDTITKAIQANQSSITFMPAPLLLTKTEAIDMTFYPTESPHSTWLYGDLLAYYGLIGSDRPIVVAPQPLAYCIDKDILSRFKELLAKKCGSY